MPFAEIINHGPEGCETLDLETSFRHAYNSVEYVRIGVLPEDAIGEQGTISFQLVHFSVDWKCTAKSTWSSRVYRKPRRE